MKKFHSGCERQVNSRMLAKEVIEYQASNIKLIRLRTFDLSLSGEVTLEDLRKVRGDGGEF